VQTSKSVAQGSPLACASAGCSQWPAPSHTSRVQAFPSSAHAVLGASKRHVGEQQSPGSVFPSSQSSLASSTPFAHFVPATALVRPLQPAIPVNVSPSPVPVMVTEPGVSQRFCRTPVATKAPVAGSTVPARPNVYVAPSVHGPVIVTAVPDCTKVSVQGVS